MSRASRVVSRGKNEKTFRSGGRPLAIPNNKSDPALVAPVCPYVKRYLPFNDKRVPPRSTSFFCWSPGTAFIQQIDPNSEVHTHTTYNMARFAIQRWRRNEYRTRSRTGRRELYDCPHRILAAIFFRPFLRARKLADKSERPLPVASSRILVAEFFSLERGIRRTRFALRPTGFYSEVGFENCYFSSRFSRIKS